LGCGLRRVALELALSHDNF